MLTGLCSAVDHEALTPGAQDAAAQPDAVSAALWREAVEGFGTGDLAAVARCAARLERLDAPDSVAAASLIGARKAVIEGFHALLTGLDIAKARKRFTEAAEILEGVRGAERALAYIAACQARVARLSALVADMAPVRGGDVTVRQDRELRSVHVEPFFVDRVAVSAGDYAEFAGAQEDVESYEDVAALWPDEETFEAQGRGRALLPPGFSHAVGRSPRQPVEDLELFQARACLLWRDKDLPRRSEGALAEKAGFPSLRFLPEEAGETPRRLRTGDGEERREDARESRGNAESRRARELLEELPIRRDDGEGFRGVLRPREFFRDLLPR